MPKSSERVLAALVTAVLHLLPRSRPTAIPVPESIKNILVIRQHQLLGDMILVIPLLRALRQKYPTSSLKLMASPVNIEIMLHNRYVDKVINYNKNEFLGRFWVRTGRLLRFIKNLRAERFDLVLVPTTVSVSFTSNLLAYLSGARVRIGPESTEGKQNSSRFLFTLPVELDWRKHPYRHQTMRNIDIANPLGLDPKNLQCEITLLDDELARGKAFVEEAQRERLTTLTQTSIEGDDRRATTLTIAFHPGSRKDFNLWPPARFARVANNLAEEFNAHIMITKGPLDDKPVDEMTNALLVPHTIIDRRPIRGVAAILAHVDIVISNDTGIMHVAAAVGTPVLSLFGPTEPREWAPLGETHRFIQTKDKLIESITVDEVLKVVREMLAALRIPAGKISLQRGSKGFEQRKDGPKRHSPILRLTKE